MKTTNVKTSELTGKALDWFVAKCEGFMPIVRGDTVYVGPMMVAAYSVNWTQGGPIIERELLEVSPYFQSPAPNKSWKGSWRWVAYVLGSNNIDDNFEQHGSTPLIAAMRCYVASKLGDSVDIPNELL